MVMRVDNSSSSLARDILNSGCSGSPRLHWEQSGCDGGAPDGTDWSCHAGTNQTLNKRHVVLATLAQAILYSRFTVSCGTSRGIGPIRFEISQLQFIHCDSLVCLLPASSTKFFPHPVPQGKPTAATRAFDSHGRDDENTHA